MSVTDHVLAEWMLDCAGLFQGDRQLVTTGIGSGIFSVASDSNVSKAVRAQHPTIHFDEGSTTRFLWSISNYCRDYRQSIPTAQDILTAQEITFTTDDISRVGAVVLEVQEVVTSRTTSTFTRLVMVMKAIMKMIEVTIIRRKEATIMNPNIDITTLQLNPNRKVTIWEMQSPRIS